jgi:hypothetical protein
MTTTTHSSVSGGNDSSAACRLLALGALTLVFLWAFLSPKWVHGQATGRGNITGTVVDPSGAVIPGATVQATNIATNVSVSSITNGTGYFEVDSLDAGTYRITVTAKGFQQFVQNGILLYASNVLNIPITLTIGQNTQVVTVTEQAPLLDTSSGLHGQSLTTRELQSIPVDGDNPMQMVELAPGVNSPGNTTQLYSMDGTLAWNGVSQFGTAGINASNEFVVDGTVNQGNGRGFLISMNADMADEVRVDTTAFDASVGHTMGVTVTETTKSGTNMIHGSATEMYQNRRWASLPRFTALTYRHIQYRDNCIHGPSTSPQCYADENAYAWPGVHENLTTFGVGGPVFIPHFYDGRNKFFWFVAGTNDIYTDAQPSTATIPTIQEQSGNFNDLPTSTPPAAYATAFAAACPGSPYYGQYQIYNPYSVTIVNGHPFRAPLCGNVIPSSLMLNQKMAGVISSLLPAPTNPQTTGGNYVYTSEQPQTFRQFTTREDYAFSQKDRVFVRFTRHHYTKGQPGISVKPGIDTQQGTKWDEIGSLGWNHVFNNSTNMDITIGGSNLETSYTHYPGYSAYPPSSLGLPSYIDQYAGDGATMPMIEFGSNAYTQAGSGANSSLFGNLNAAPSFYRNADIRGDITHIQGTHTIRAGAEWRQQHFARGIQGNSSGIFNFDTTFVQQNDGTNKDCTAVNCNLGLPGASNYGLSYAALLMGVPTTSTVNKQAPVSISTPYYNFYIGDTWRVTPKLTVIPGIRFEYEYGPSEKHNYQIARFDFNQQLAIAGPAKAAYATVLAGATAAQRAALPSTINVQGGPLYAGVNGAPTRQWNNNYRVLPRIAFAYQLSRNTVFRAGYGIFFDTLNANQSGTTDQTNFTASTGDATGSFWGNFGQNLSTATPPVTNPFPVTNGSQFIAAVGAAGGNLSYLGASPTIYQYLVPDRAQRLQLGVQRQFGASLLIDIGYTGSWSTHLSGQSGGASNQNLAPVPASFYAGGDQPNVASNSLLGQQVTNPFSISNFSGIQSTNPAAYNQMLHSSLYTNSTIPLSTLVKPYPFMGGLSEENPIGQSHFNGFHATITQRMSHGLDLMVDYRKNYQHDRDYFQNPYDTQMSWEPSNATYPWRLTTEGIYELPFGRGKMFAQSGWKSAIFGGFRLNGTYELNPATMLGWGNLFYQGPINKSNILLKHPIYNQNIETGVFNVQWLKPGNVTATVNSDGSCSYSGTGFVTSGSCQPNGYNERVFPTRLSGVRSQQLDNLDGNIQRNFKITEKVNFQARMDVFDVFNHQLLGAPNTSVTNSQFGFVTASLGANGAGNTRWINIQGHISF